MRKYNMAIIKEIIALREKGFSLPEISQKTNIPKTTVYHYIKNVLIKPEFLKNWAGKRGGSIKRKKVKEEKAYNEALKITNSLTNKEKLLMLAMIYWGEGNKKDFSLSNTDPGLISLFVLLLREILKIKNNRLRGGIRLYEDLDKEKSLQFWAKLVKIPKESFTGIQVLPGKKKGKLQFGMFRIRVLKGESELKKLLALNKAIVNKYAPIA